MLVAKDSVMQLETNGKCRILKMFRVFCCFFMIKNLAPRRIVVQNAGSALVNGMYELGTVDGYAQVGAEIS